MNIEIVKPENIQHQENNNNTVENDDNSEFLRKINFITLRRKMLIGE